VIISRNPVFLFSVLLILISGCNTKRESLGSDNEIIVIASIEDQEDIRNVLKKYFPTHCTHQNRNHFIK